MTQTSVAHRLLTVALGLLVAVLWAALLVGSGSPAYADDGSDARGSDSSRSTAERDDAADSTTDSTTKGSTTDSTTKDRATTDDRRGPQRWGARSSRENGRAVLDRISRERSDLSERFERRTLHRWRHAETRPDPQTPESLPDPQTSEPLPEASPEEPRIRPVQDAVAELRERGRTLLTGIIDRPNAPKLSGGDRSPPEAALVREDAGDADPVLAPPTITDDPVSVPEVPEITASDTEPTSTQPVSSPVLDRIQSRVAPIIADILERPATTSVQQSFVRPSAAAISSSMSSPGHAPLLNLIGSAVFNIVGAALQIFSGPPVLPANSTVTVRSSSLTMPGTDQTVRADWYFPETVDDSTQLIYLQHGFMATGSMYSYTAAHLAQETNSIVVAPSLSSNLFDPRARWLGGSTMHQSVADLFAGDRVELTESATAAAGAPVDLPDRFVLVGHSLGGMLVTGAAGRMAQNGVVEDLAGVVLLDAVDTNRVLPGALDALGDDVPVLNISSERYVWNLGGVVGDQLEEARPGQFNGVVLVGGRHIDALQGGNVVLQLAEYLVAGFSQSQNIEAVKILSADWINDMFAGGVSVPTESTLEIPTSAGTATAVVLPFRSTESVQALPWDGVAEIILDVLFRFAVYEPMTAPSSASPNHAPRADLLDASREWPREQSDSRRQTRQTISL